METERKALREIARCGLLLEELHSTVSTRVMYRMLVDSEPIISKGWLKNTNEITGLFLGGTDEVTIDIAKS